MRLFIGFLGLLAAMVVAMPAIDGAGGQGGGDEGVVQRDVAVFDYEIKILVKGSSDRAATLWKLPHFNGENEGNNIHAVPAPFDSCQPFDGWYGHWDKTARSIAVEKGFKCSFFTNKDCKGTPVLVLGDKDRYAVLGQLPKEADKTLSSAKCGNKF